MTEICIAARKFVRLLDYLALIGLDVAAIAEAVNLDPERIANLPTDHPIPAQHYSRLYRAAAIQMQKLQQPLVWGAGIGGETFELMCHCIIGGRTLGDALRLAARFDQLLYPQNRYRVELLENDTSEKAKVSFLIDSPAEGAALVPEDWDRADTTLTACRASGLRTWHALCGWLIGQPLSVDVLQVQAPNLNQEYRESLARIFNCPVHFDAPENTFTFDRALLDRRVVHTGESLNEFLSNCVYDLIAIERLPTSTSSAIKSLLTRDLPVGMPSFSEMAAMLFMSESSLRRRLQDEKTSYQAIKDEVRTSVAIDKLLYEDARVVDVAELLGFTEANSFVRSFKNWTGYTPRSYKKKMQAVSRISSRNKGE